MLFMRSTLYTCKAQVGDDCRGRIEEGQWSFITLLSLSWSGEAKESCAIFALQMRQLYDWPGLCRVHVQKFTLQRRSQVL